jgi:hypothetical protein
MKDWQRIRAARSDLTDYVIHFTKFRSDLERKRTPEGRPFLAPPFDVFCEILNDGFICPTFAPIKSMTTGTTSNTVRGPDPAVCLTEQPLSAVLSTRQCAGGRYSGFGIAYHKYALFETGGRPVFYGSKSLLGTRIQQGEPDYEDGKDIFQGGLPKESQYLFVQYKPTIDYFDDYPVDWTWKREWRVKSSALPVFLADYAHLFKAERPVGALIVERDEHLEKVQALLRAKAKTGASWAAKLTRIVSEEKRGCRLRLAIATDQRCALAPQTVSGYRHDRWILADEHNAADLV